MFGFPTTSNRTAIVSLAVVVALLCTAIGSYLWGSNRGYAEAEAKGNARYNELKAEHAAAVSESLAKALDRAEQLTRAGNSIAADLITARAEAAQARATLSRRIPNVSATVSDACRFGPAFVQLLNELAGLGSADLPQAADPGRADGRAPASGTAGAGLRQSAPAGEPIDATPEDLAAWLRDYAGMCGDHRQLAGKRLLLLKEWAK